jgi:exopolysaccharide biosynthesis polyprenyl glycosylphosphotransferase
MNSLHLFLRRNWRTVVASGAIGVDMALVVSALLVAAVVGDFDQPIKQSVADHSALLVFVLLIFMVSLTAQGIYRSVSQMSLQRQMNLGGGAYMYALATILAVVLLVRGLFFSRVLLLTFFALFPVFYVITWVLLRKVLSALRESGYGRWKTLAIGSPPYLNNLLRRLEKHRDLGYDVVDVITIPHNVNGDGMLHVERSEVENVVRQKEIEFITFSSSQLNGSYDKLEGLCKTERIGMRVISPEADILFSKAGIHDAAGIAIYSPNHRRLEFLKSGVKRLFDILGSLICLVFLFPLFIGVALATKIESHGPVFFRQRRSLTDEDEPFVFVKFRSMYNDADQEKESLFEQNESSGALFKLRHDPRVTRIGRFIRRYSIDEIPQLINVLKGDMSLVGPRPLPVSDYLRMQDDDQLGGFFRQRVRSKPGMTGLWQVSGRSELGFREMVLLDLYYIEHQTLLFDLEILAQTIPVVLFGKGAY